MVGTALLSTAGPAFTVRPCRGRSTSPTPTAFLGQPRDPHLPCRPWRAGKPEGSRDRVLREGRRGCWRSLCARGLYCFLLPLREVQLAHLRANTGQSEHTKRRGGRGICDLSLSRRAESLFAGPRLALRACPHTAGADFLWLRARGVGGSAPRLGHVRGLVCTLLGAAIFLKSVKLTTTSKYSNEKPKMFSGLTEVTRQCLYHSDLEVSNSSVPYSQVLRFVFLILTTIDEASPEKWGLVFLKMCSKRRGLKWKS